MRVDDLQSIQIKLASPEDILFWSHGEVVKPETINYRTQRAEKDGLFCEKIFGPEKDFQCYCGKYRGVRYKGIICDKCGVEITKSSVRRERMGHIKLAAPCSHIWFLRGVPSIMSIILDIPAQQLEQVIYFNSYIITEVKEEQKNKFLEELEREFKEKIKNEKEKIMVRPTVARPTAAIPAKGLGTAIPVPKPTSSAGMAAAEGDLSTKGLGKETKKLKRVLEELKEAKEKTKEEILALSPLRILSEVNYHLLALKYGEAFQAGTGAETLRKVFEGLNLTEQIEALKRELGRAEKPEKPEKNKKGSQRLRNNMGPKRGKAVRRLRLFERMKTVGIRPEWMFLTVVPLLPPDLRPMVQLDGGRYASSDLNDLYRRVINRNNRLKYLLEIGAPEVIVRNEKRLLQEAVDALIDNSMRKGQTTTATTGGKRLLKSLADALKGKQGRFRQNLLGKRVDYSGRSVIIVGPELNFDQVGLPKKMALELFKPFVIKELLNRELAHNIRGASRLIEEETDDIWAALEKVVQDKLVLLNRAPTLHRLGIQAFEPILIEGKAIRVHPLVCKAFNADFDGDQMAVHLPLSVEAQKEAKEILRSSLNLLKPATGSPVVSPSQDIILGCYFLTGEKERAKGTGRVFGSPREAILSYEFGQVDLRAKIKVRTRQKSRASEFLETTVGRLLFNEALPSDFPFINEQMNSKGIEKVVTKIIENYPTSQVSAILDNIKNLGFEFATLSGTSWGMDDLIVPPEKKALIEAAEKEIEKLTSHYQRGLLSKEEKKARAIEVWQRTKLELEKLVPEALKAGSVFNIIDAGARGSWVQPVQMAGMKGLVINPAGEIIELPVKSSFKEGLSVLEYFISTHGARKGTADTALRTSAAGYLTRRLIDVSHEVIVCKEDCHDTEGWTIFREEAEEIGQNFIYKILGRICLEIIRDPKTQKVVAGAGEMIDRKKAEALIEAGLQKVRVRTALTCRSIEGVCQKCYGWDLAVNKEVALGEAVGIIAAQAIGEPGTQLTMRTFHTGGVAGGGDITAGLPRVEEIFEAREPAGKAQISWVEGRISEVTSDRVIRIIAKEEPKNQRTKEPKNRKTKKQKDKKELKVLEFKVAKGRAIWVNPGQEVFPGTQLSEGHLDIKELFKVAGREKVCRYILKEIQGVYVSQGAVIHDKHIEVIIRQMFSRVRIMAPGDSIFNLGEIVERSAFLKEQERLKKAKLKEAKTGPVMLGISKVALTADSFLSAASFQETSRVLIKAAIEGKEDKLLALKENVIIGKLIPAGRGFRK